MFYSFVIKYLSMAKKERPLNIDNLEKNRKRLSFKIAKVINRILVRKPHVKFLGEEFPNEPILLLANHVGKKTPVKIELYYPRPLRMWSTHEMTEGFKATHKYLTTTYYHQKKHLPKWFAYIVGTLASPFANMFYLGMRLIPTYTDYRFFGTIKRSIKAIEEGQDVIIYPEDSSNGYKEQLTYLHPGFVSFLEMLYQKGIDLPVYATYLNKRKNLFIVSDKMMYSSLKKEYGDFDHIAEAMRILINSLMDK